MRGFSLSCLSLIFCFLFGVARATIVISYANLGDNLDNASNSNYTTKKVTVLPDIPGTYYITKSGTCRYQPLGEMSNPWQYKLSVIIQGTGANRTVSVEGVYGNRVSPNGTSYNITVTKEIYGSIETSPYTDIDPILDVGEVDGGNPLPITPTPSPHPSVTPTPLPSPTPTPELNFPTPTPYPYAPTPQPLPPRGGGTNPNGSVEKNPDGSYTFRWPEDQYNDIINAINQRGGQNNKDLTDVKNEIGKLRSEIKESDAAKKKSDDEAKAEASGLMESLKAKATEGVNAALNNAQSMSDGAKNAYGFAAGVTGQAQTVGTPDDMTVTIAISPVQNLTFSANPFSSANGDGLAGFGLFVKRLIAWTLVAGFFVWCMSRIREMVARPFNVAPFGDSLMHSINSIHAVGSGGGLGYLVRIGILLLVVPLLLTIPVAVTAAVSAGLPWSDMTSILAEGGPKFDGYGSLLADAAKYINQVLPLPMLVVSPAWYVIVEYVLFPSQVFWMMFIKLIP